LKQREILKTIQFQEINVSKETGMDFAKFQNSVALQGNSETLHPSYNIPLEKTFPLCYDINFIDTIL
jgi:hypothetical protein